MKIEKQISNLFWTIIISGGLVGGFYLAIRWASK